MTNPHTLRRPMESRRALRQRKKTSAPGIFLDLGIAAMLLVGCGAGTSSPVAPSISAVPALQAADVQNIVQAAVNSVNADMVVAVVDRAGFVLGVFRTPNAPATAIGNFAQVQNADDVVVALARTGAFFSNDQAPLSSRTVRFISGIHFPPGVMNQPPADLYGIENTNRGCTLINDPAFQSKIPPSLTLAGGFGLGVLTGKADMMDSNATAVNPGGVPIFYKNVVVGGIGVVTTSSNLNVAEYAAFAGATAARSGPTDTFGPTPAAPGVVFIGGIALPFVSQTARPAGFSGGPAGGTGSYLQTPDGTVFSIDVAASKARNMVYFNSAVRTAADLNGVPMGTAVTNRTISFGAQPLYPPGIDGSSGAPFFNLYTMDLANPCTQGFQSGAANANKSGIVFFPGSAGLFRNGALVGGLGVSGDGVDQDDYVTNGGTAGFEAPASIRADQIMDQGVRLPYLKFPRNPTN